MPEFQNIETGEIVTAHHIPELPLGSSIFRHRDECIRIAKVVGGTTGLGNGGIWVTTPERFELAPLGSYLVKIKDTHVYVIMPSEHFLATFKEMVMEDIEE